MKRSARLEALLDRIALEGIEAPEDAIPLVLEEIASHPRRSPKVEAFLESLLVPEKQQRRPHYVAYYSLDSYIHTLKSYCYAESDDIAINATDKSGKFLASMVVSLPARFGYSNDWTEWRRAIAWWLRSLKARYGYAVIEDLC